MRGPEFDPPQFAPPHFNAPHFTPPDFQPPQFSGPGFSGPGFGPGFRAPGFGGAMPPSSPQTPPAQGGGSVPKSANPQAAPEPQSERSL